MSRKGRHAWIPSIIIGEIEDIQHEEELTDFSEAFKEMANHARVGREVKRMMKLDFKNMLPFKRKGSKGFP